MRYFNTEQSAEKLSLPVPTFRKYRAKGLIPGSKPGKRWLHSEDDLQCFYDNHKVEQKTPSDFIVNRRK